MLSVFAGAFMRACAVFWVLLLPALAFPTAHGDAVLLTIFGAFGAAVLVLADYNARSPGVIEFRDAPPVNRIRFTLLFLIVTLSCLFLQDGFTPTTLGGLATTFVAWIGRLTDVPFSPAHLMGLAVPDTAPEMRETVSHLSGAVATIAIITTTVAAVLLRHSTWPLRNRSFNLWVNLPTFEPAAPGDLPTRLSNEAFRSAAFAFLLPYAVPALLRSTQIMPEQLTGSSALGLVCLISAWAMVPTSLAIRALAIAAVVRSVSAQRAQRPAHQGSI